MSGDFNLWTESLLCGLNLQQTWWPAAAWTVELAGDPMTWPAACTPGDEVLSRRPKSSNVACRITKRTSTTAATRMPDEKGQSTAWDMDRELAATWSGRAVVAFQNSRSQTSYSARWSISTATVGRVHGGGGRSRSRGAGRGKVGDGCCCRDGGVCWFHC
jgi:hypothetical protein